MDSRRVNHEQQNQNHNTRYQRPRSAFLGLWHCSTAASFSSLQKTNISSDSIDQEIRTKNHCDPSAPISKYIDSLNKKIAEQIPDEDWDHLLPQGVRKEFFKFAVIESETENAFAVPGGYTYFYTAILKNMKTEAELIGVMGHEIGHVVKHHSRDRILKLALSKPFYLLSLVKMMDLYGCPPRFGGGMVASK